MSWTIVAPAGIYRCTATNGHSYSLTNGGAIFRYEPSIIQWVEVDLPTPEPIVAISANEDSLIAQTYEGNAYIFEFGTWSQFSDVLGIKSCSSGGLNTIVVVDKNNIITKHTNGVLSPMSLWGGPTKVSASAGCVHIWGVDDNKNVYRWNNGSWEHVYGISLVQVDVSVNASGALQVYGVDANGRGWKYNGTGWNQVPPIAFSIKYAWLEARADYLWAVTTTGVAYHRNLD